MERVFEYEIPQLHPLVVHFPIALLVVAALVLCIWAFRDRLLWLRAGACLSVLGAIGALVANRTGEAMEEEVAGAAIVEALVDIHDAAADWTVLSAALLAALSVALLFSDRIWPHLPGTPRWVRLLVAALALTTAVLVAWTGHVGGVMVWGVGR